MRDLNKKVWNKYFKEKGRIFLTPQENLRKVVNLFKKHNVKRVLNLGCGSGRHVVYFAKEGFEVYGIDIAEYGIRIAKDWVKGEGLKAHFKVGDIYKKLPYKNNFFDAIVSIRVLHHGKIEWIRKLIKEMKRVLKYKGLIFITVRKRVPKKLIPKDKLYGIKFIAPRTYIILGGPEKGMPHYNFNKEILKKEFKDFRILGFWIDSESYYCLLGQLRVKT